MEILLHIATQLHDKDLEGGTEADNSHTIQSSHVDNRPKSRTTNTKLGNKGIIPRYTESDFSTCDSTEDLLICFHRYEQFFTNQWTVVSDKISLTTFHMLGKTQLWYYKVQQEEPDKAWETFVEYCTIWFGPPLQRNPLGKLVNLNQTGLVEEYQR